MKLKKVVSLALAGVMAVSMLAACGTEQKEPTQDNTEVTKTGYSAEFAEYLDESITDLDYVTVEDNATDAAALKSALSVLTDNALLLNFGGTATLLTDTTARNNFSEEAELTGKFGFGDLFATAYDMGETAKRGTIYLVDGTSDLTTALKTVASKVNNSLTSSGAKNNLPEQGQTNDGTNNKITYNYHYVISVSVVNRGTTTFDQMHPSVNAIAVTITRTGTPANA